MRISSDSGEFMDNAQVGTGENGSGPVEVGDGGTAGAVENYAPVSTTTLPWVPRGAET